MIRAEEISKSFGRAPVLTSVTFSVERGERVALVGQDSRAQTVMLRILGTIMRPTTGRLEIAGVDALRFGGRVRGHVMWAGRCGGVGDDMDAAEYVRFIVSARGVRQPAAALLAAALDGCGVDPSESVGRMAPSQRPLLDLVSVAFVRPAVLLWDDAVVPEATEAASWHERLREITSAGTTIVCATRPGSAMSARCERCVWIDQMDRVDDYSLECAVGAR
jgi:ABC-2 type transport system ATP-binding protein